MPCKIGEQSLRDFHTQIWLIAYLQLCIFDSLIKSRSIDMTSKMAWRREDFDWEVISWLSKMSTLVTCIKCTHLQSAALVAGSAPAQKKPRAQNSNLRPVVLAQKGLVHTRTFSV